jgi:Rad3-related DNA helicase
MILEVPEILLEADDESYLFDVEEIARTFKGFMKETYLTVTKKENTLYFHIVTTNLKERFNDLLKKNKLIILMSGTLHSKEILTNIFGLEEYKIIEAEIEQQGAIIIKKTGKEFDCKYANFSSGKFSRREYLENLNECVRISKKPCLIHVNAFIDLPSENEKELFELNDLISREELYEIQEKDKEGKIIRDFKNGLIDVLFSTKVSRGIDFPGEECNSIVFTKYPNPNVEDAFWKILMKTKPEHYWEFYKDKARRELLQKVYRGLRFKEDKVEILSPDLRVIEFFENRN